MHSRHARIHALALAGLLLVGSAAAQEKLDREYTDSIRANTTDAAYSTEWVDHLPASETLPTPKDFLGYPIGDPGVLTHPDEIIGYFEALAAASDRIQIMELGRSHGGRRMIVAALADPKILARLEEIKEVNQRLSDPRMTNKAEAKQLAASVPATYYITAGLHSPETGPPEMVMELAYRLIVSDAAHIREIRENVLTLITPVLEMDGRARTVDWNRRYLQGVKNLKDMPPSSPPYWGDYTLHDNNRDGLQVSQPLTRNYNRAYHEFLPTVSLDLHESVPLLYVSMGTGPYNETISPITVTEWQWMASYDVSQATKLGLNGVWTWGFYTGWYPGYLLWVTNNHNAVGRFYETFGNSLAGTYERDLKNSSFADERVDSRQWYRPDPPKRIVNWSLRNNTNFMQSGVLASLQLAARNGETLLFNFWQKSFNSMEKGKSEAPYAFVIPAEQRDPGSLRHTLWLLEQHGIEVHSADTGAAYGDISVAKGDYVVRMDQPYRNYAKTLFSPQRFPADAEHTPYDDISWNLPMMLGVEVSPIDDSTIQQAAMTLVGLHLEKALLSASSLNPAAGRLTHIVENKAQAGLAGLAWAASKLNDVSLRVLTRSFNDHPAGSLVIANLNADVMGELAEQFGVKALVNDLASSAPLRPVRLPRVALFHTWTYTQDSGWARYTLEELGIPYKLINKDALRDGSLNERFDVILVPNTGRSDLKRLVHGIDKKWSPMPYTQTQRFTSHGIIDQTDDMTGGMGFEGLGNLQSFVEQGGTLITLGSAGILAADSGIAPGVISSRPAGTPGSHVTTKVLRPEHPATFGFGQNPYVFHGNLPLFSVSEHDMGRRVMQFGSQTLLQADNALDKKAGVEPVMQAAPKDDAGEPEKLPDFCLSGLIPKESSLQRQAALLDIPVQKGHVLIYAWNPLHRYQNHHDFAFLTNAMMFNSLLPSTPTEKDMLRRERTGF